MKTSILLILFLFYSGSIYCQRYLIPFQSQINGKYGYIDQKTKDILISPKYDNASEFQGNVASVKRGDYWGYINLKGKEITPFKYEATYEFINGLAQVYSKSKFGFIDKTGKEIIPLMYSYIEGFNNDYCVVALNSKFGLIDKKNRTILDFKYGYLSYFYENVYVATISDKSALILNTGLNLTPYIYDKFIGIKCNLVLAIKNNHFLVIDKQGHEKDFWVLDTSPGNGLSVVIANKKYGLINKEGKVIASIKYDYIDSFKDNLSLVCIGCKKDSTNNYKGGKWGFINQDGQETIPLKYDKAFPFEFGRAKVILEGQLYYVNYKNEIEIPIGEMK